MCSFGLAVANPSVQGGSSIASEKREQEEMAETTVGHFVWHEHMAKDEKASIAFYSEIIGWKTEAFGSDYTMWVGEQGPLGGVMALPKEAEAMGAPPHWLGYVHVDNVDQTAAAAEQLGGRIYKAPDDIPTIGRFAVLGDPQGGVFAAFKALKPMPPHAMEKVGEVCWNELMTSDSAAGFEFYAKLFSWKILDRMEMGPMGTYLIYGVGEKRLGGMMTIPPPSSPNAPAMRPGWIFYFQTPNLEQTIERAKSKGATLLSDPMTVPGGGRIAQLLDPQGAVFALHQNPPPSA